MNKVKNVWVIARDSDVAELTSGAAQCGENITLIYWGDRKAAVNADRACYLGELGGMGSFAALAPAVARLVAEAAPELVLLGSGRDGKLAAAHIAAACKTSALTDAAELVIGEAGISTSKMVYGGAAIKTERGSGTVVVCAGAGLFSPVPGRAVGCVEDISLEPDSRIRLTEKREKTGSTVDLRAAKKIVGIGRGVADEECLESCKKLAEVLGAELGCTRPICEERGWMARELYIGVSGVVVQPDCYVALGISGQVQHVVGVNKAGTIIAVDKNEAAPIFKACDYGIVGDLGKIVPALQKLIEG